MHIRILVIIAIVLLVAQITTGLAGKDKLSMILCAATIGTGVAGLLILSISG